MLNPALNGPGRTNLVLGSLSLASGCIDVQSFLQLGDVFTSAMTGNSALLAIALGQGRLLAASRSLCALLSFALGVALATLLDAHGDPAQGTTRRLSRILLLELVFLGSGAILWSTRTAPVSGTLVYAIIALSALSMGVQVVGARSMTTAGISTIVFTTALTQIVISATSRLSGRAGAAASPANTMHQGTFAAYVFGAVLAALLISHDARGLIWLPVAAVSCALGLSLLAQRPERNSERRPGSSNGG